MATGFFPLQQSIDLSGSVQGIDLVGWLIDCPGKDQLLSFSQSRS